MKLNDIGTAVSKGFFASFFPRGKVKIKYKSKLNKYCKPIFASSLPSFLRKKAEQGFFASFFPWWKKKIKGLQILNKYRRPLLQYLFSRLHLKSQIEQMVLLPCNGIAFASSLPSFLRKKAEQVFLCFLSFSKKVGSKNEGIISFSWMQR